MPSDKKSSNTDHPPPAFVCKQCGECCIGYGGTYVSHEDIERISAYIGVSPDQFKRNYCQPSGDKQVLVQKDGQYCIFWDKLCTIHEVKPIMCRKWPYIESLLVDFINWQSMASMCPGIRKTAKFQEVKDRLIQRQWDQDPNLET